MKLEVGMYVRFTNYDKSCQYIGKIANINEFREPSKKNAVYVSWYDDYIFIGDEDIVKASHQLIDLIDKGDYVNGSEVVDFENRYIKDKDKFIRYGVITENCYLENNDSWITEKDIKSIVTKEQFNSTKYEVGE